MSKTQLFSNLSFEEVRDVKAFIEYRRALDRQGYRPVVGASRGNYSSAIYYDRSGERKNVRVLYLGETIEAAFIETFGRRLGIRYISREFIQSRNLCSQSIAIALCS